MTHLKSLEIGFCFVLYLDYFHFIGGASRLKMCASLFDSIFTVFVATIKSLIFEGFGQNVSTATLCVGGQGGGQKIADLCS